MIFNMVAMHGGHLGNRSTNRMQHIYFSCVTHIHCSQSTYIYIQHRTTHLLVTIIFTGHIFII